MTFRSTKLITNVIRYASTKPTTNNEIQPYIYNRNPRNLEKLRIDRKPTGYPLDQIFVEFWHKLELTEISDYVVAQLVHNTGKVVVEASTNEWAIYKYLYSKTDKLAFITLGKVFGERCVESGILTFAWDIVLSEKNEKIKLFKQNLEEEGLTLTEMPQFDIYNIWHKKREKRPWTVLEDND